MKAHFCIWNVSVRPRYVSEPVGARLAGEGVLESAFAGKPGSYRSDADP